MNDRDVQLPPQDLDAEAAVLSAVLLEPKALPLVQAQLGREDFYSARHGWIFEAAVLLAGRGEPVDAVTVGGQLRDMGRLEHVGGKSYLVEVMGSAPAVANIEAYAKRVRDQARLRRLIATCQGIAAEAYLSPTDASAFSDLAEQRIHAAARDRAECKRMSLGAAARQVAVNIAKALVEGRTLYGAPSGMPALDRLIRGLRPGRLHVLAARPSVGKSALALMVARFVAESSGPVLFVSCEMGVDELSLRALSEAASIDNAKLDEASLTREEMTRLIAGVERLERTPVEVVDGAGMHVLALRAAARKFAAEQATRGGRMGLIVVDYLQLVEGVRDKGSSREQEVASIARSLKKLAQELEVPVLALSQLSRSVEARGDNARPKLSDLRESGSIEQDSDVVMFIHRERMKYAGQPSRDVYELIVAKARGGKRGIVKLAFHGPTTSFREGEQEAAE